MQLPYCPGARFEIVPRVTEYDVADVFVPAEAGHDDSRFRNG